MKKILEVQNITKIYKSYESNFDRLKELFLPKTYHKEFIANKDISFELFEKETLGIIGVNGAGKSTILKIISGVISPTRGKVIRNGRITALLELGTGFNDELSGLENIFLNGTLVGMSQKECEDNKEDIISFSELGEYIYEPIKNYSSGMKMRLAFSIAIYSKPQVLIVDEALSVGDAHFQAKCTKALKKRKDENMSIIYVSHDLNSLKFLCDRIILLEAGKALEIGRPEDIINKYNFLIARLNDDEENLNMKERNQQSFGTFDAEILKIDVTGEESNSSVISSGEIAIITLNIKSNIDLENINVGITIRNKFGQDIFGTNLFYHEKQFHITKDKEYLCKFIIPMNLGIGLYSISAAIVKGENHLDYCLNWVDNLGSFEIAGVKGKFFIGVNRLEPIIEVEEI